MPRPYSAAPNGYDNPGPPPSRSLSAIPGSDRRHSQAWLSHNPTLFDDRVTPNPDPTLPEVQQMWRCSKCGEAFYTVDERDAVSCCALDLPNRRCTQKLTG